MCAINDTVAVVLDPSVAVSNGSFDGTTGVWTFPTPYGILQGISACINKSDDSYDHVLKDDHNNDGNLAKVIGNERHGQYCWVKLTHPVSSRWVLARDQGSKAACNSACLGANSWYGVNGLFTRNDNSLRTRLFGSVSD